MTNVACTVTFFAKLVDVGVAEGRAMHKASFSQDFVWWKISDIFPKIVSMWTKNKWLSTMRFDQNKESRSKDTLDKLNIANSSLKLVKIR